MKLDFNKPLLDLSAKPIQREDGSEPTLAEQLYFPLSISVDPLQKLKFSGWARTLYAKEPLVLDKQDGELLKKFINEHPKIVALTAEQLMDVIIQAETDEKK